jgi:hypothetical protein
LCAEWELARLCGKKQKPWLKLTEGDKKPLRRLIVRQGGLQELPMDYACSLPVLGLIKRNRPGLELVVLVVDFAESEAALVASFRHWLRSSPSRKEWRKNAATLNARWRSLLAKVVVLRATEANLKRKAAIEKTAELWRHWQWDHAAAGLLSASHWSRALREAKALRKSLASLPSMMIGDPPYSGAKMPGILLALDEFPELARRRRIQVVSPKP